MSLKEFDKIQKTIKNKLLNEGINRWEAESRSFSRAQKVWLNSHNKIPTKKESDTFYEDSDGNIVRENVLLRWNIPMSVITEAIHEDDGKPLKIKGRAINVTTTRNKVEYTGEELQKAAHSLVGKPILNSHKQMDVREILGKIENSLFEGSGIDFEGEIDPEEKQIVHKVKRGYIDKVSIGAQVAKLIKKKQEDGEAEQTVKAQGIEFLELSLVPIPGDANAGITQALHEAFNSNVKQGFYDNDDDDEEEEEDMSKLSEAMWDTKYVNDLSDAAFAVILAGGTKDVDGKTVPRSLRKLPHHNKSVVNPNENTTVDIEHLRNALARLSQTDMPENMRALAKSHLNKHADVLLKTRQGESEGCDKKDNKDKKKKYEMTVREV